MKLQAIKKCCNDYGTYVIFNCPDGQQWLGNGAACWPVEGIRITKDAIPALFDIPGMKQQEMDIRESEWADERLQIVPIESETMLADIGNVLDGNTIYKVLQSEEGVLMIDTDLTKPAERGKNELRYFLRRKKGYSPMVAVYADMFVGGLVMPITPKRANCILNTLADITRMRAQGYMPGEETAPEGEQMSMEGGGEA